MRVRMTERLIHFHLLGSTSNLLTCLVHHNQVQEIIFFILSYYCDSENQIEETETSLKHSLSFHPQVTPGRSISVWFCIPILS